MRLVSIASGSSGNAVYVGSEQTHILVDAGISNRRIEQGLNSLDLKADDIQALVLTHEHSDHVGGLDDLRPSNVFGNVNVYTEDYTARDLRMRLPYCFTQMKYPGVPGITLHEVRPFLPFKVKNTEVLPIRVMHGDLPILGFRIGNLGYVTDMKTMPQESYDALKGLDVLIMNALHVYEHPTHQSIQQAIENSLRIGAKETYFIHMSHHAGLHADTEAHFPPHIHFAYDGLELEF